MILRAIFIRRLNEPRRLPAATASELVRWSLYSALLALVASCSTTYRMGEPIHAGHVAPPTSPHPSAGPSTTAAPLDEWDLKWAKVQGSPDTVSWVDHFRICAIKYRYRNYDALFRCLDLFDKRIARGGKALEHGDEARQAAPVLSGWLRASAYADLGDRSAALKSAELAWAALPERYRRGEVPPDFGKFLEKTEKNFTRGVWRIAGMSVFSADPTLWGRDNPAALDMGSQTIAMSLAAQRAVLYQQLGRTEEAKVALGQLEKWGRFQLNDGVIPFVGGSFPYGAQVQLLSLGPLYAAGSYAQAVTAYEAAGKRLASQRRKQQILMANAWLVLPVRLVMLASEKALAQPDVRAFAVASEDAANALLYASSLARTGRTADARAMFDSLLEMPELRAMGNLYWVVLYARSQISQQDGKPEEAIGYLRQSVDAIESVRGTIAFEAAKIGFAGDKQAVYADLVRLLAESGDWTGAFMAAERAKARSLVDLLAQHHELAPPHASDDKVRALLAQAAVTQDAGVPGTESEIRGIKLVADSRVALSMAAPEAASLLAVQTVPISEIRARLAPDEALVDYFVVGDDLYAFVLNGSKLSGFRLSARGLDADVRAFRDAIQGHNQPTDQLGARLYDRLIRPLSAALTSPTLTISPNGPLHYLPFAALKDGNKYLVDQYSIRLIPSAGTLAYLRTDHPARPGTLLALGNPDLGDSSYNLPNAQAEAEQVAAMFPDSRALVGAAASKGAILELGSGFAMLHFATHGKFNADTPLASGLYLAKEGRDDGVLTVDDLYSMRLDADLVTLSACETALGQVANGDDVIGLTRGFLYAGARSIVASLWEVDDAATKQLMLSFYRNLKYGDKREALRLAQIETRAKYPEPLYWAAFQIVGQAE